MQAIITTEDQAEVRAVVAELELESQIQPAHGCNSRVCVMGVAPGQYVVIENNGGQLVGHVLLNTTLKEAFEFVEEREKAQGYQRRHTEVKFPGVKASETVNN